jgi:hypothetical protein
MSPKKKHIDTPLFRVEQAVKGAIFLDNAWTIATRPFKPHNPKKLPDNPCKLIAKLPQSN